jgi:hypothetical protein
MVKNQSSDVFQAKSQTSKKKFKPEKEDPNPSTGPQAQSNTDADHPFLGNASLYQLLQVANKYLATIKVMQE